MIQLYIAFDLGFDIVENLIPNVFSVLTQLVSTDVLLYVFVKLVYKPVINWLDGRAQAMQEDLSVAQAQREDAQLLKEKAQEIFVSADHKAYEIVEKGRQEAIKQKDEILASARDEAQQQIKKAKQEIENERQEMLDDVRREIIDVALAATEQLPETEVNETTHGKAVDDFIAELRS